MNNDTNIISDDDFLKEIFENVKNDEKKPEEISEIDEILLGKDPVDNSDEKSTLDSEDETKVDSPSEEEIDVEEKTTLKRFGVRDTISTLIESGTWEDMPIKYGEKEYDSIEDLIEKEKPSKELFELLSQAQKQYRETKINESYIKVGDKDSTKAKLVHAILNDIPYEDLLEYNSNVVEPLQKIDFINTPNGDQIAEAFVRQCLVEIDNYHPDSVDAVIDKLKKDFRIIEKAEQYQRVTIDNFEKEIEKREFERNEQIKEQNRLLKEDMSSLREELKKQSISDAFSSKILKLRYTQDPNSGNFHYQELIKDKIKDKGFEARLMHFLLDEKDFIEKEKSRVKTEVSKQYLELMHMTPSNKGSKETKKNTNNLQTDDEELFRELGLLQ